MFFFFTDVSLEDDILNLTKKKKKKKKVFDMSEIDSALAVSRISKIFILNIRGGNKVLAS